MKSAAFLVLFSFAASGVWAEGSSSPAPAPQTQPAAVQAAPASSPGQSRPEAARRPRIGLVLSGGGARGFAHVGVLKVLEEAGVKVDLITATSMGSMVGGGYAEGYSPEEIEKIIKGVNWQKMFAPKPDRAEMNWRRKEDKEHGLSDTELGIGPQGFALPYGIITTQELDLFLSRVNEPASRITDLSRLPIPFAAFGTDLETGRALVLQKDILLSQAMRASMSIPGAFAPTEWKGHLISDGGLVQNLPVEEARKQGADIVIAVNVGTPLSPRSKLNSLAGVMGQMINILTEQNVQKSISELTPRDIFIVPDLEKYSSGDFDKADEIIRAGEEAARKVLPRLRSLAVPRSEFLAWSEQRRSATEITGRHVLAGVRVEGLKVVNPANVEREIKLKKGDVVTTAQVERAAQRIWQDDDFLSVPYHFEPGPDGTEMLVFEPQEKTWGYSAFRVGGRVQTNFRDDHTFSFMLEHTLGWINAWGGELKTAVQIGEDEGLQLSYYQPLGVASPVFLNPRFSIGREDYDVYEGDIRAGTWQNKQLVGSVELGYEIGRYGVATAGLGYTLLKPNRVVGTGARDVRDTRGFGNFVRFKLDRLNSTSFPTAGYKIDALGVRFWDEMGRSGTKTGYELSATGATTVGPWTFAGTAKAGRSPLEGTFKLGGAFNLSGSSYGRYSGDHMEFARLMAYRNLSSRLAQIGAPVWAGVTVEGGRAYNKMDGEHPGWKSAAGVFLGADTWVGPIYLVGGRTFGGDSAIYFMWGHIQ